MRILFLTHSFNSLSQRLYVELRERGHEVSVEFDINDSVSIEAVDLFQPDLIIAPFLKRALPEEIWRKHVVLVVHPGIAGDRGPSALDWAILNNEQRWGVTVLQANGEMDMGDIWATVEFPMRDAAKASLYRAEVSDAAVKGVLNALDSFQNKHFKPEPLDYGKQHVRGQLRPLVTQSDRGIDWRRDNTATVLRKIRSADGFPGVVDVLFGRELYLYDARPELRLTGEAGAVIACCGPAICRATCDGAIWIGHVRDKNGDHPFKLPATQVLSDEVQHLKEIPADDISGYREIWYEEEAGVGFLYFNFYNGAMNVDQCRRLRQAFIEARNRDTRVIVLMGGADFWSNGIHLNCIEASASPAESSWDNINAIDDLALEIITTESHLTVSALRANAGAGGVFLARAADEVWAGQSVVLNPHYKDMGNLFGSEYWTYLLPKYAGMGNARRITRGRLPMGAEAARELGLIDRIIKAGRNDLVTAIMDYAITLSMVPAFSARLKAKQAQRRVDEAQKPLAKYRQEELEKIKLNFYGFDPSYHVARYNFVYKIPKSRTPVTIARHRDRNWIHNIRDAS